MQVNIKSHPCKHKYMSGLKTNILYLNNLSAFTFKLHFWQGICFAVFQ